MKFDIGTRGAGWLRESLRNVLRPGQVTAPTGQRFRDLTRQGLAVFLSALMIMIPMWQGTAFAQSVPPPVAEQANPPVVVVGGPPAPPQEQPLSAEQLNQLTAPIALYPDALVAQILAAATYPTQVVEADRWRQALGNATAEQVAARADTHNWDPSVKALTAFPTVLAQMDRNIRWTTDLGNAYYNQPADVLDSVQVMRQKALAAGHLRSTPQLVVTHGGGVVVIAPANPTIVYVPVYDPWVVYGAPFPMYPGYYYGVPPGSFWGGLAIGFGAGIGIGYLTNWGWGWHRWGMGWRNHSVYYNHNSYYTRSATVVNRGFTRPGGPPQSFGARGAYVRPAGGVDRANAGYRSGVGANRPGGAINRSAVTSGRPGGATDRSTVTSNRPGGATNRSAATSGRPGGATDRSTATASRSAGPNGRASGGQGASSPRTGTSRASGPSSGSARSSGSGGSGGSSHPSGGGGGGGSRGSGHEGHSGR